MELKQELQKHKLRVTQARLGVLKILKNAPQPVTLDDIVQQLSEIGISANLSTIYRILEQFENSRILLKSVPRKPFQPLYEYRDDVHSHHLICVRCGEIQMIANCPLEDYEAQVAKEKGYIIQSHRFDLYGLCGTCQLEEQI